MTDAPRCEPPPELRDRDGWHWVEAPAIKMLFIRRWWRARGEWCWADMDERTLRSFRYLAPVATPADVAALRAERDDWKRRAGEGWQAASDEAQKADAIRERMEALQEAADAGDDENATLRADNARLREALVKADEFITNGIEFGFIRMPSPGTPDPALLTPGIIRAAMESKP